MGAHVASLQRQAVPPPVIDFSCNKQVPPAGSPASGVPGRNPEMQLGEAARGACSSDTPISWKNQCSTFSFRYIMSQNVPFS